LVAPQEKVAEMGVNKKNRGWAGGHQKGLQRGKKGGVEGLKRVGGLGLKKEEMGGGGKETQAGLLNGGAS